MPDEEVEGPSIREALRGASAMVESRDAGNTTPPEASPPSEGIPPPSEGPEGATPPGEASEKPRDEEGKFTKAPKAAPAAPVKPGPVVERLQRIPPPKPGAPVVTAPKLGPDGKPLAAQPALPGAAAQRFPAGRQPAGWTAKEKETWSKLPQEAQIAVLRGERESATLAQENAELRKSSDAFKQVIEPYTPLFKSEGVEPLGAVSYLLSMAAAMRTAPEGYKAGLVANWIRQFRVDPEMVANHLMGQPVGEGAPGGNGAQRGIDPNQIIEAAVQRLRAENAQAATQQFDQYARGEIEKNAEDWEFLDTALSDGSGSVADAMADYIEVQGARGVVKTPQSAYDWVCRMDPGIAEIMAQRKEAETAAGGGDAAAALEAASSVKSQPGGLADDAGIEPGGIREALYKAARKHGAQF